MPANLRFRYSVCSCKAIYRAEQAIRHYKLYDSHKAIKVYTCCISCCAVATEEEVQSGDFYSAHAKCVIYAANSMKARVFLQMRLKEDNINIELTQNKRTTKTSLVPPTAQHRRTDSSSSSSSSSSESRTSCFHQRPNKMRRN